MENIPVLLGSITEKDIAYSTNNVYLYVWVILSLFLDSLLTSPLRATQHNRSIGPLFLYPPSHSGASPALFAPHRCHCYEEPAVCNDRSPSCFCFPDTTTSQTTMKTSSSSFSSFPVHFRRQTCTSELKFDRMSTIFFRYQCWNNLTVEYYIGKPCLIVSLNYFVFSNVFMRRIKSNEIVYLM